MQISLKNTEGLQSNQSISSLPLLYATCSSGFFFSLHSFILKNVMGFLLQSFSFAGLTFLISLSTSLPKVL